MPWDAVLREAAVNLAFWQGELSEPALLYDWSRVAPPSLVHRQLEPEDADAGPPGKRRKVKAAPGDVSQEVCFKYSRDKDGCATLCFAGRRHVCEGCGRQARTFDCCYPEIGKKGKGKGRKGAGKAKKGAK